MLRSHQAFIFSGMLLIVLTLVSTETVQSQSALQQLQQIGGSMPNVPEVPPPTYDREGTEAAWDITHPGWREWQQQSSQTNQANQTSQANQANQAEILALKKQQAEQQRLLEETRKKQRQEEQRRRELEQYWRQVMNQQRQAQAQQQQEAAERQRAFEQARHTLLVNFRVPPVSAGEPGAPVADPENAVTWSASGYASFGRSAAARGSESGLSPQQWRRARQYQEMIETLHESPDRQEEDEEILVRIEAGLNALWTKAVTVPGLPDDAREALALALPITESNGLTPRISREDLQRVETAAKDLREVSEEAAYTLLDGIEQRAYDIPDGMPESVVMKGVLKKYGAFLSLTKILMAAEKGGASSAIAETVDFALGTLPLPGAKDAVDGGRVYASVAFQATNRFMTDAMAATGGTFDSEAFWGDFKNDLNVWQKAVMEFIHYGPKN